MNPKTGEESDPKYEAEPDDPTETTDEVPIVRPRDRGEHGARRAGGAVRVDRDASSPLGDAGTAPVAPQDDPAGDDVTAAPPTDTTSGDAPTASARRDTGPTAAPQTDTATVEPEPEADTAAGGPADTEPAAEEPVPADTAAGGSADTEPAAEEPEREADTAAGGSADVEPAAEEPVPADTAAGGSADVEPAAEEPVPADTAAEGSADVEPAAEEPVAADTAADAESNAEGSTSVDSWGGLAPLGPDDLAALDPSVLEEDLGDDDLGEIVEVAPPDESGPASGRTADDLTSGTVLRNHSRPPQSGWRRLVYELTGGMVHPRLSRSERERAEQLRTIRTLVTQPRRITVLSRKGGVGKTTTTLMLGQTLASERGDRIVAVDGNPDAGSLGYRVGPTRPDASITDLLSDLDSVQRYADMRRFTSQTPSGLEVLISDDDPQISTALGEQEYSAVMAVLDRFYNLILTDTGTGILDSAVQGILDGTDQIVLVVAPSLDAARAASQTLDWLSEHGFVGLVESAVTVINQTRRSALVDVARIEEHFWDRCGATVRVPWDRYLEAGAETELADLRPATRAAYMQLAAAVAGRFEI